MHKRTLIAIGYWFSYAEPELPKPQDFIDTTIGSTEKKQLIDYLRNGKRLHEWMGFSRCRFGCKLPVNEIGNACLTDGIYIWPEGLPHYIIEHHVCLLMLALKLRRSWNSILAQYKNNSSSSPTTG